VACWGKCGGVVVATHPVCLPQSRGEGEEVLEPCLMHDFCAYAGQEEQQEEQQGCFFCRIVALLAAE
jgi:hypothetical protein